MAKPSGADVPVLDRPREAALVLAVGLGRGFGGKSTGLSELVWRAQNQGRDVIVADGDARRFRRGGQKSHGCTPLKQRSDQAYRAAVCVPTPP